MQLLGGLRIFDFVLPDVCVCRFCCEVQRSVCACISPGDSPAQLLYVVGDCNISDNSEKYDEYF